MVHVGRADYSLGSKQARASAGANNFAREFQRRPSPHIAGRSGWVDAGSKRW